MLLQRVHPSKQEIEMTKYLLQISYSTEGTKGLIKEGGTARRRVAQDIAESLGGRLESMYFAFGDTDAYVIAEMPDNASVAAISLALGASGGATGHTTVLMTPEEMDLATRKTPAYRAPGK
jgi:uncharacterized protein with GYD domain